MPAIRVILLVLSIIQFIVQREFWAGSFYLFFIWIILFQLLWFYIEKTNYKKVVLLLLAILAITNVLVLPEVPYFLLALLVMEIRLQFNLKATLNILASLLIIQAILAYVSNSYPTVTDIILVLGISAFALWGTNEIIERQKRDDERYAFMRMESELKNQSEWLKTKMSGMEEISRMTERNRISRDLHDSVGHTLSTIVIQLAAISKLTEASNPKAAAMLNQLHEFTKNGLTNVRHIIHELKPSEYQRLAFTEQLRMLIQEFEANSQMMVFFNANDPLWELKEEHQSVIYRAVQEFLGNSAKHSNATEIRIQYHFTNSAVILTLEDNGQGTDYFEAQMGITGMKERAELLGGKVGIQTASGSGFKVRIVLPKGGFIHDNTH